MIAGVSFVPLWAIAVVFLILMAAGLPCPVWHHTALVGAYGAQMAYNAGCSEISVLLWGFAFGVLGHYAGDLSADWMLNYGEGYVDPPSASMLICSPFAFVIFPALGLCDPEGMISVIAPIILIVVLFIVSYVIDIKRKAAEAARA